MHIGYTELSVKRASTRLSRCLCCLLLTTGWYTICSSAKAQNGWFDEMTAGERLAGPSGVVGGPYGRPQIVLDEFGQLKPALRVYEDSAIESYIPDITSPGWVSWHALEFRQQGTYTVMLYTYAKSLQQTTRELVSVDTRKSIATVREGILGNPIQISLTNNPPRMAKPFARVTQIVKDEIAAYKGLTAQDALTQDRIMAARMAAQPNQPYPLSSELNSSISESPVPVVKADTKGVYKAATHGIEPPLLLFAPDPQPSEEARAAKFSGNVEVYLVIDEQGTPSHIKVARGVGLGLDEKAIEAVRQYRFKPAMLNGKPVKIDLYVDVNFQVF